MRARALFIGVFLAIGVIASGCGRDRTGTLPPISSPFDDAGSAMDAAAGSDGGGSRDAGPSRLDGGGETDAGSDDGGSTVTDGGAAGQCDPGCLDLPGAFCCTTCGCGGTSGACEPECSTPYIWDCELGCCFDYDALTCAE